MGEKNKQRKSLKEKNYRGYSDYVTTWDNIHVDIQSSVGEVVQEF